MLGSFFRKFGKKPCVCEDCHEVSMIDIDKKPVCESCGSHNMRPKKRPV
jgi:Zn finger protein HypA/HybF involved in hydrogenase expression